MCLLGPQKNRATAEVCKRRRDMLLFRLALLPTGGGWQKAQITEAQQAIKMRIPPTMVSSIPLVARPGTKPQDPHVYVDFLGVQHSRVYCSTV